MWAWLLNPAMLGLGALAVASPILIHLLNKRRFKIVDWAAMDFLFEAEKKNRRRVQLENFILLALRCLAMLLVGLMLARPFLPSNVTGFLQQAQKYERILLIDDSLSQRVLNGSVPSIEMTKDSVKQLLQDLAESDETDDWLTVMLTSNPAQPLLANEPLTRNTVTALASVVDDIRCTDRPADYSASMMELSRYVSGEQETSGRVVYVYTDLRERDWVTSIDNSQETPNKVLDQISMDAVATFLVDVGSPQDDNLAITSLRPLDLQVANKVLRFEVEVANLGAATVSDVRVLLQINDETPQYEMVKSIAPGQKETVAFRYMFNLAGPVDLEVDDTNEPHFSNYRVRAEIDRQAMDQKGLNADQLIEDSEAFFASRVLNGVSVLLVDGQPSSISERSETHYLKSLAVLGTGLEMDVATISELERVSLSNYRVIFLCNVSEASSDRIETIGQWVEDGGSLVIMPGNQVRASLFNDSFYRDGTGLSPIGLIDMAGDPTMSKWVNFEIDAQIHPALQVIVESDSTSLSKVDVFSWWTSKFDESQVGKSFTVPLRLNDSANSPAMVDRRLGDGHVMVFTIPGDGDWTVWPSSPTFAPVMIDMIDYLIGDGGEESEVAIGSSIGYPIDLSAFQSRVSLRNPQNEKVEAVAKPIDGSDSGQASEIHRVTFENIDRRGFYELGLTRHGGDVERVLFSANVDTDEAKLKRLPAATLEEGFFGDRVALVSTDSMGEQTVKGGDTEIWPQILMVLFGILALEQFLGWHFGRNR